MQNTSVINKKNWSSRLSAWSARLSTLLLLVILASPVFAQTAPVLQKGDAVVTGYSGVALLKPAKGADPVDYAVINQQGSSVQVFDLSQATNRADAQLIDVPRTFAVPASKIGQVFGVALDNGRGNPKAIPNVYVAATSAFGLQLVKTEKGVRNRAKKGGANRSWMGGQFGAALGGGPGSVWKIDGLTGEVSLFHDIKLDGAANTGPALGNIEFDRKSQTLFVSDLQTGMIHAIDLKGNEVAVFDHGRQGRPRLGLEPVEFDPNNRTEITSPQFDATKPSTWGFAAEGRRVWGMAIHNGRLYYAVAEGPEIWSVGITSKGNFEDNARPELEVLDSGGDEISDVSITGDGTMYLSQRGKVVASYDYSTLAQPKSASVLRYRARRVKSGRLRWQPAPDEYPIGFSEGFKNTNGGHALGYGYDKFGDIRYELCGQMLWTTGELLRKNAKFQQQLKPGGPEVVHGLQGIRVNRTAKKSAAPLKSIFVDYDGHFADPGFRGHLGDVAVWSSCGGNKEVAYDDDGEPPPLSFPKEPRLRIAKSCSQAVFNGRVQCRVSMRNTGGAAPEQAVEIFDVAKAIGAAGGGGLQIVSATPSNGRIDCSALPANDLTCSIPPRLLRPGRQVFVDVTMDVASLSASPNWRVRNCAEIEGTSKESCSTVGANSALIVEKSGPSQGTCIGGGPCDFEVSVTNPGKRMFDGEITFADNLSIGGVSVGGINVNGVFPTHGCSIPGSSLPLQWQCDVMIPPGGTRTFSLLLDIPKGAIPAGVTSGRNCFVALGAQAASGAAPFSQSFWQANLAPGNATTGKACVNFNVQPAAPNQTVPPRVINGLPNLGPFGPPVLPGSQPGMTMVITAAPSVFSNPGEVITFTYTLENTGNVPITLYEITDPKVSPGGPVGNCSAPAIPIGGIVTCSANYVTTAADMNSNIVAPATVTGQW